MTKQEQYMGDQQGLVDAVLAWWEESKDDVDHSNFDDASMPRYTEPPMFVRIAQELKQTKI